MNNNESEVGFEVAFEDSSAVKHKIPDNAAEIFCAIKINDGGMLAAVTEGGGDLDFIGKDGLTPLAMAVMVNSLDCVRVLLDGGAGTEIAVNGFTPLMIAVQEGYIAIAALLIEKGANVNACNAVGLNALMIAARDGHIDILNLLLDNGADAYAVTFGGSTALNAARSFRQNEAAWVLEKHMGRELAGAPPELLNARFVMVHCDEDGSGPDNMHEAAETGHAEVFQNIQCADPALNRKDEFYGRTPLHFAALAGQYSTVLALVEKGARVDIRDDREGRTALHFAAESGNVDIIKLLIEKGAEVNAAEDAEMQKKYCASHSYIRNDGYSCNTPLYIAAKYGRAGTAAMLIECGADPDIKCSHGNTAAHCAAAYDRADILKLLHDSGADLRARNEAGVTPADLARHYDCRAALSAINECLKRR